jgi:hypothetical protein
LTTAGPGQESSEPLFWLERSVLKFWAKYKPTSKRPKSKDEGGGDSHVIRPYIIFAILFPLIIPISHGVAAVFTGGLDRFRNDFGLVFTVCAWVALLLGLAWVNHVFEDLFSALPNLVVEEQSSETIHKMKERIWGRRSILFSGLLCSGVELSLVTIAYPPWNFLTGFREAPYVGPALLAMDYTSIPNYALSVIFWAAFFFLIGNGLWIFLSSLILMSKRTDFQNKLRELNADNLFSHEFKEGLPTIGNALISAIGILGVPIALLLPVVVGQHSFFPSLSSIYPVIFASYAVLVLMALLLVVIPIHLKWKDNLEEYKKEHQSDFGALHALFEKKLDSINHGDFMKFVVLSIKEQHVDNAYTWPIEREPFSFAVGFAYTIMLPIVLTYILPYVVPSF